MEQELSFGQLIKEHRRVMDLTQAELARRVGCAAITLRKIEADSLRPSVQMAGRLAMALNIPLEERSKFVRLARTSLLETPEPPSVPTPRPSPDEIGEKDLSGRAVRGYELGEQIGSGGAGAVYRAIQPVVDREVAIKIILPKYANHPEFIRCFEAEAQLVARLEHPHIVPLYDYWREPNAAYLVMRLLRGGSLGNLIEDGPLPLEMVLRVLEQIGLALHSAHRFGVIHRDIKPANILLDEDQNAYLADFGVAKNLGNPDMEGITQVDGMIGSPAYISPEQIRADTVMPQADIYCLGVMVYEMLTGELPFQGPTPMDYVIQHLNSSLPLVREKNADLSPSIDHVLQRATAKEPLERFPDVLQFLSSLFEAVDGGAISALPKTPQTRQTAELIEFAALENPYKGLRAFKEADEEDFFGRETLIQEMLGRMAEENDLARFLSVVGPSGSGKSSVVKAGLIPALRRGGLPGSDNWFIVDLMPGSHPLEELEAALLRIAVNPPESLLGQLREDHRGLLRAIRRVLPAEETVELVLIIDQFEEVFTLIADEAERTHFLDSLVTTVLDPRSRLRVVVTLRADFTDRPLQYADLGELMRDRTEFVLPLTPDEMEQAILGPARRIGLVVEPGLTTRMIREIGEQPGTLPLLQYALTELFERREGNRLTLKAYEDSGGVMGALGRRAENIYNGLEKAEQESIRQLFLRLVTLGEGVEDTRRRVLRSEINSLINQRSDFRGQKAAVSNAIDVFGKYRFLTFDHDPATRGPTVEVAHEALLREWPRLRSWLNESRDDILMQRLLAAAAMDWEANGFEISYLMRGTRLEQFYQWVQDSDIALSINEQTFLDASLEARRDQEAEEAERQARETRLEQRSRRFLQALVGVFAIASLVAFVLSVYAFNQRQAAQTQASILLASQAETELDNGFTDRAVLLALEALEKFPYTAQAERALGQAVSNNRALGQYLGHETAVTSVAWSPDGTRVASSSTDNTVHIWDAVTNEPKLIIDLPQGITGNKFDGGLSVKWTPDGKKLVTLTGDRWKLGSQDFDLILWDAMTGEQLKIIEIPNQAEPEEGDIASGITNYVTSAAIEFAPQSGRLATVGGDNTALIWDEFLKTPALTLQNHENDVNGVAWSPNEQYLATASEDGTASIWDIETGLEIMVLDDHKGAVNMVVWSPDGTRLATASDDGTVRFWDTLTGEEVGRLDPHAGIVWSLAWSSDGTRLATGTDEGVIRVWKIEQEDVLSLELQSELSGHQDFISSLAWSPIDDRLASADATNTARVWNAAESTANQILPYSHVADLDWSSDGRYLALPMGDPGIFGTNDPGKLAIWDVINNQGVAGKLDTELDLSWFEVDYSPDDSLVATRGLASWPETVSDMEDIYILDSGTGKLIKTISSPDEIWLRSQAWSPDGTKIAGGSVDNTLYLWDFATGELLKIMEGHEKGELMINQVVFSPNGEQMATASDDGTARIWDTDSGETIFVLDHESTAFLGSVAWSPDGNLLLTTSGNPDFGTGDNTVRIWVAGTGKERLVIQGHTGAVALGDWSPDGNRIVSSSGDGSIRIWNAETGDELLNISVPVIYFPLARWSPDGKFIAIALESDHSEIWRVWQTTEELIEYAYKCCVWRELTPGEREQFGLPERW